MKKLIALIIILQMSLLGYSQIDTIVPLPLSTARMIFKELKIKDGLEKEISEKNKLILLKDEQILIFKQKDTLKDQKIKNLETVLVKKDEQFSVEQQKSKDLLKELKTERRKTFIYKAGTFLGLFLTSFVLLK